MRLAVLGGGISGLAAASGLLRAFPAARITLFEAAPRCGGVIGSERREGLLIEKGPLAFPATAPATSALLADCGIADRFALSAAIQPAGIWQGGRVIPVARTAREVVRSGLLSRSCMARLALEPFMPRSRADDESVGDFFRRRTGRAFLESVVEPLSAGLSAGDPDALSMACAFPELRAWERGFGGLAYGLWKRERARKAREPDTSAWPEGNGGAIEAMVSSLRARGIDIRAGARVDGIGPDGKRGVSIRTSGGAPETFDGAISCLRAPDLLRAFAAPGIEVRAFLEDVPYASIVLAYLAYRKADLAGGFRGAHCLAQGRGRPGILSLSIPSRMQPDRCPPDMELVRVSLGGARDPDAASLGEESLHMRAAYAAERILAPSGFPEGFAGIRHPAALPQLTVGHARRLERARDRLRHDLPGFILSGTATCGAGIERAVSEAGRACGELAARLAEASP